MDKSILTFDHVDDYERLLKDHVEEITKICTELHIPFFFTACVSCKQDENGRYKTRYCRAGRTPAAFNGRIPEKDEISSCYSVSLGAQVIQTVPDEIGVSVVPTEGNLDLDEEEIVD